MKFLFYIIFFLIYSKCLNKSDGERVRVPIHRPTQNDLLVAMHMAYLVLLIVALFRYIDEQTTLCGLHRPNLLEKGQAVTEKQDLQFLTPQARFANGAGSYGS